MKFRRWLLLLLAVVAALALALYLARPNHSSRTVVYSASGSFALADLCITTPSGEKCRSVSGFAQVSVSAEAGDLAAMSARVVEGSGTIRCTITVADVVRASASGPGIAYCQAIVP